jgi:hypothetical protein
MQPLVAPYSHLSITLIKPKTVIDKFQQVSPIQSLLKSAPTRRAKSQKASYTPSCVRILHRSHAALALSSR